MNKKFDGGFSSILKSFLEGAENTSFSVALGDTEYDNLDYPTIQLFMDSSNYQGDLEYEDSYVMFFVFEQGNPKNQSQRNEEYLELVDKMEEAIGEIMKALERNGRVKEFKPVNFEAAIAENTNNRLDVIEVTWGITKLERFR